MWWQLFLLLLVLIDNAYACDPRIKYFKEKVKEEKEAQKRAKQEAAKSEALKKKLVTY